MLLSIEKNKYFVKEISLAGEGYSIILQYSKFGESKDIYRKPEPPAQTMGSFLWPIISADEKRSMLGTVLQPKGMVEWLRWEVRKGNIQYKIYLNWSDSYFTNPFIIFPHIVSQTFREADEGEEKNTEKGKHRCTKVRGLHTPNWSACGEIHVGKSGSSCLWATYNLYLSQLISQKTLTNQVFYAETVCGIFPSAKCQTQEIQSREETAVFGDYYSFIQYVVTLSFMTENFKYQQYSGINPLFSSEQR